MAAHGSLTLERGLHVLRVLGEHPDGLTVSQLAATLGTHRAGIYRMLGPLIDQRYVVRRQDGRHTLGVGLLELASRVRPQLQEVAVPELRRLADELRATTALTIRDGEEAVVAAVVEPRSTDMHIAYRTGLRHPVDVAASGLAILAGCAPRPGEREEVRAARRRGYARSSGELLIGATGVGGADRGGRSRLRGEHQRRLGGLARRGDRRAVGHAHGAGDRRRAALGPAPLLLLVGPKTGGQGECPHGNQASRRQGTPALGRTVLGCCCYATAGQDGGRTTRRRRLSHTGMREGGAR